MLRKKNSGAQNRKRRLEKERETAKCTGLMANYLKKIKTNTQNETLDSENQNNNETESEAILEQSENVNDVVINNDFRSEADIDIPNIPIPSETPHLKNPYQNNVESGNVNDIINNNINIPQVLLCHDFGYLEYEIDITLDFSNVTISQQLRTEIISRGSLAFQNIDSSSEDCKRIMPQNWFKRQLANGNVVNRSWLLYSPLKQSAYCFCCLLFKSSNSNTTSAFASSEGFNSWKHTERLKEHENSKCHRELFTVWKETERRINKGTGIDFELEAHIQSEKQRWRDILKRFLSCIKYLAIQNLALRGHIDSTDLNVNSGRGNFISLLTLIATYDPLLASHMEHVRKNPNSVSYLSPKIQNEFINIMADTVRNKLLNSIRKNKYYSILLDSTPDLSHREQLSVVIRFVDVDFLNKEIKIQESFLGYINLQAKDAASIEKVILEFLESNNLPLADCRGQCYDNASVMSGHISGLQKRVEARNHRAIFVNCDNHSLNLVGVDAASQDAIVITFFDTVERIYLFFSRSTLRWQLLSDNAIPITFKKDCETRWSSRAQAVKAIYLGLDQLVNLLESLKDDQDQTKETNTDAEILLQNILKFSFIAMLFFWHVILCKIDRVQKRLQDPTITFKDAAQDLNGLKNNLSEIRDNVCFDSIRTAKEKCSEWGIEIDRRIRRRRKMPGELARDSGLSAEEEMDRVMKQVVDRVHQEINTRFSRLDNLNLKYGFLLDVKNLLSNNNNNLNELQKQCIDFGKFYDCDVNGNDLYNEICDCNMLLNNREYSRPTTPLALLHFIISYGDDVFPNLRIGLQILLTIAVSIASCERSFSKLKLILSYLRTTMNEDRLNSLALLSIEKETLDKIDFDQIIDEFASSKARKINV